MAGPSLAVLFSVSIFFSLLLLFLLLLLLGPLSLSSALSVVVKGVHDSLCKHITRVII